MRLIMKTLSQDAKGMREPGKEYDVPDEEAKDLIKGGFAIMAEPPEKVDHKPRLTIPESTMIAPADETTMMHKVSPKSRGRRKA